MGLNLSTEMTDGTLEELGIHLSIEDQMHIHLRSNFYPPIPASMVQPCIEAIYAAQEDDDSRLIELPDHITWKNKKQAPAYAIIENHRLENWVGLNEDYLYLDEDEG